jgi:hypothetical protein
MVTDYLCKCTPGSILVPGDGSGVDIVDMQGLQTWCRSPDFCEELTDPFRLRDRIRTAGCVVDQEIGLPSKPEMAGPGADKRRNFP